ncbi:MAG: 5'/3'-nucleotidase SurE [Chloroflexota bacterium]
MHILLTNDNGFAASGLWEMAQALRIFGKVTVLVPEQDWASEGCYEEAHAMRIRLATLPDNSTMIVGCGNPSDCVSYGLMGFLSQDVDLVVSGVNAMPTAQHHLAYSAGVTAVTEAVMLGVPGIAVSMPIGFGQPNCQTAVNVTCQTIQEFHTDGLAPGRLLNIQVPSGRVRGVREAEQDLRIYYERLAARHELAKGNGLPDFLNSMSIDYENPAAVLASGHALVTTLKLNPIASQAMTFLADWGKESQANQLLEGVG